MTTLDLMQIVFLSIVVITGVTWLIKVALLDK